MQFRFFYSVLGIAILLSISGCGSDPVKKTVQSTPYAAEDMLRNDSLYKVYPALHAIDFYHYDSILKLDYNHISFDNQCFFAIAFFEAEYDLKRNRHDSLYKIIEPLIDTILQNQDSISRKQDLELPLALLGAKLSSERMLGKFSGSTSSNFMIKLLNRTRPVYAMVLDARYHHDYATDNHSWPVLIDSAFNRFALRMQIPIVEQLYADFLLTKGDTLKSISLRENLIANGVYVFTNCDKVISYYASKQDWNKIASYLPICKSREFEYRIPALIPYYLFIGDTTNAVELLQQSVEDTTIYKSHITARIQLAELYIRTGKYSDAEKLIASFPFGVPVPNWPAPSEGFNYRSYQRNLLLKFCRFYVVNDTQGMQDNFWQYGTDLPQIKKDAAALIESPLGWY